MSFCNHRYLDPAFILNIKSIKSFQIRKIASSAQEEEPTEAANQLWGQFWLRMFTCNWEKASNNLQSKAVEQPFKKSSGIRT